MDIANLNTLKISKRFKEIRIRKQLTHDEFINIITAQN